MNKWVKYGAIAAGAYVAWRLLNGAKISELLSLQSKTGGSEGKANTVTVGGKPLSLPSSDPGVSTGNVSGGDGSVTAGMLDKFWTKQADGDGPIAPGNPINHSDWVMS